MTTTRSKSGRKDDDQGCVQNAGLGRIIYKYNNIMYIVYIIIIYCTKRSTIVNRININSKPVDKSKRLRDELDTIFSPFFFFVQLVQHHIILNYIPYTIVIYLLSRSYIILYDMQQI